MVLFVTTYKELAMKILNVMFSKVNGGLEQVFLNYIPALIKQGNQVISVIHPKAQIRPICPQEHLKLIHNFNQHDYIAIYKLRQLIKKEQPDCIITHSYRAAYLIKKTNTKIPKIAVCHVRGHYDFGADALIALTETMRQDILKSGKSPNSVFTVPNMVELSQTSVFKSPRQTSKPIIGVCARFAAIKGVDVFIKALAELKNRNIEFEAKIAGDGKEKKKYVQLIQELDLQHSVRLLGWIEDTDPFYQSLDIFCLPSREEAFGLVILEAMKHSLPMVLTHLSGPLDIIGNTQGALFVQPEDPIQMADALERLITDKSLVHQLASQAHDRVQKYSSDEVGPLLHGVLAQICKEYS